MFEIISYTLLLDEDRLQGFHKKIKQIEQNRSRCKLDLDNNYNKSN